MLSAYLKKIPFPLSPPCTLQIKKRNKENLAYVVEKIRIVFKFSNERARVGSLYFSFLFPQFEES